MNRAQLEHVVRASASVAGVDELVVVGSQAILAARPDAPAELLVSMEADVYPPQAPDRATLIDGSIGELSPFHQTFGYYAHGVSPETARLPADWRTRAIKLQNENTGGVTAWCLAPADLAVSKLLAGREKDFSFVRVLLQCRLVEIPNLLAVAVGLTESDTNLLRERLARLV